MDFKPNYVDKIDHLVCLIEFLRVLNIFCSCLIVYCFMIFLGIQKNLEVMIKPIRNSQTMVYHMVVFINFIAY
ncbi:hypothetical protein AQUCO_02700058v1 [Aquilegia coerulea]|uniref:Uncharacterized protein n=1 Tax=Aquilegia coerulea TaxID=218851 RepID=A0A2G5D501_AQUCA|nr:hypothetical protein AQUCO_02700058v1 [Aquilegia coerulea]